MDIDACDSHTFGVKYYSYTSGQLEKLNKDFGEVAEFG